MKTVTVRGVTLGEGRPKVIVPLCGAKPDALLIAAHSLGLSCADLIEWRVDGLYGGRDEAAVLALLPQLRAVLGKKPLLVTCRTKAEGGDGTVDDAAYASLCRAVCESGQADLVDIELSAGEAAARALIACAHENGVAVILSSHDFANTPPESEMVSRLCRMQALGADIAKLAVMPQCRRDVAALLAATAEMADCHNETPVITMSMGQMGVVSRLAGEAFGCAATFAAAGHVSAPGQPNLEQAQTLLAGLHECF